MRRPVPALLLAALPAAAHMVSISTGEMRIEGTIGRYELRMPMYEIAHVKDPDRELFEHLRFFSGGRPAQSNERRCKADAAEAVWICTANYRFDAPIDTLIVESRLHSVTVPNHVHLLRAFKDGRADQAVLDYSFPRAEIRFRPPTAFEIAAREFIAGLGRALGGAAQLLFLTTLVLAARSRLELVALAGAFIAGEIVSAVLMVEFGWTPAPRFIEAAMALTIAYLAVEILFLPLATTRWLVAAVLGIFHGLYFGLFLQSANYSPHWVLAGVTLAEITLIALLGFLFAWINRFARAVRPVHVAASVLLAVGIVWFVLRLKT
jgi:hypothetical protein